MIATRIFGVFRCFLRAKIFNKAAERKSNKNERKGKKCCEEKLNVTVCEESQISHNVLKYMNLFYKN